MIMNFKNNSLFRHAANSYNNFLEDILVAKMHMNKQTWNYNA